MGRGSGRRRLGVGLGVAGWLLASLPAAHAEPSEAPCEPYVPLSFTREELEEAGFKPGGFKPFLLALFAGPRIALEWNDGRGVRPIELLRSVPYLGNVVGLYLCTEALSGYRMTAVAGETGIDDWRRRIYFQRIEGYEAEGRFREAARPTASSSRSSPSGSCSVAGSADELVQAAGRAVASGCCGSR